MSRRLAFGILAGGLFSVREAQEIYSHVAEMSDVMEPNGASRHCRKVIMLTRPPQLWRGPQRFHTHSLRYVPSLAVCEERLSRGFLLHKHSTMFWDVLIFSLIFTNITKHNILQNIMCHKLHRDAFPTSTGDIHYLRIAPGLEDSMIGLIQ